MPKSETIWIIGASEGIGAALAREWSQRGARVILSARSQERLDVLAAELGSEHIPLAVDVSHRTSIDAAAAKIAEIGALDRIVHLAAIYDPGKIADLDPDKAMQIVSTNLTGSFHIAQVGPALLRKMSPTARFVLSPPLALYSSEEFLPTPCPPPPPHTLP